MSRRRSINVLLLVVALILAAIVPGYAQSTTKSLSTNFTLVNLSALDTSGTIDYYLENGTAWRPQEPFNLAANAGQAIFRQYTDPSLPAGRGSVVVGAGQAVGSVVQIRALNQNPTSNGAYVGLPDGDPRFYVPLVAKQRTTASGIANSQIVIQNTGQTDVNVEVDLLGTSNYTKPINGIKPGAAYLYDVALESNISTEWLGSAVVRALNGEVAVVSNFFTADAMQTFNGFASSSPGTKWFVPQFTSRLANSLSTPVSIQNLSGAQIPVGVIQMSCKPAPGKPGAPFTVQNTTAVDNNMGYAFNPVVDMTIPADFDGSCIVNTTAYNVVVFVQMRFVSRGEAAAYEAIRGGGTATNLIVPLVAKRLPNGFATAVLIQNLDEVNPAQVDLLYVPSPEYVAAGGNPASVAINDVNIDPGANLIQSHRVFDGVPQLPPGWQGSLKVTSNRPVGGYVQLTFLRDINPGLPLGDNFMAHTAFAVP